MTRSRRPQLAMLLVAAAASACGGGPAPVQPPPAAAGQAVIVIAVDGLRADHLGCYSAAGASSAAIDALAGQGTRFASAFTQATAGPAATASLLTALYPTTHGVVDPGDQLVEAVPTLAESFLAAGWEVGFFADGASALTTPGLTTGIVGDVSGAAAWLHAKAGGKLLLVVGLSAPVSSVAPATIRTEGGSELDRAAAEAAYAAAVTAVDGVVGELLAAVEAGGLAPSAVVVVAGTHGLRLGEQGAEALGLAGPETRVPLVIRRPGGAGAGVVDQNVELVDVMPTVLELAGVPGPTGMQGTSLLPLIEGAGQPPYIAFAEAADGGRMVALGGVQMVVVGERTALYDLAADPLALTDVAQPDDQRLRVMTSYLESWGKMVAAASYDPARKGEELDPDTLANLRSLGYIQ